MAWYRTGTCYVANGAVIVYGVGTAFVANVKPGDDWVGPNGLSHEIQAVNSDTQLTLVDTYLGTTVAAPGQAYKIKSTTDYARSQAAGVAALINSFGTIAANAGAGKFGDGTEASPGIAWGANPGAGFYRPGSNTVALALNGTEVFRATTSAFGFGTKTPAYFAHFQRNQAGSTRVAVSNSDAAAFVSFDAIGSNTTLRMEVDTGSTAATIKTATASPLRLGTNNTNHIYLDTSGNVTHGWAGPPSYRYDIYHSINNVAGVRIKNDNSGTGADARLQFDNGTVQGGVLLRGTGYATAANQLLLHVSGNNQIAYSINGTIRALFDGTGVFQPAADNTYSLGTDSARWAVVRSAQGIKIGTGTSSDPNTLDYYEEGTFTPTVSGTSAAGTGTYTTQTGRYTRVGNRVHVGIRLVWSGHTGTGNLSVAGLPFTPGSSSGNVPCTVSVASIAFAGQVTGNIVASDSRIFIVACTTGAAYSSVAMSAAGEVRISATYEV